MGDKMIAPVDPAAAAAHQCPSLPSHLTHSIVDRGEGEGGSGFTSSGFMLSFTARIFWHRGRKEERRKQRRNEGANNEEGAFEFDDEPE